MKDRFKFRIWDKPTSKMFYDVCLGYIKAPMRSDWVCVDTPDGQISYTGDRLKDIEIMQCTGLKDKNGKLVYEGDIIKTKFFGRDIPECHVNVADYDFFVVVFEEGMFRLLRENPDRGFVCGYIEGNEQKFEVIGSIYKNPELLEVEND